MSLLTLPRVQVLNSEKTKERGEKFRRPELLTSSKAQPGLAGDEKEPWLQPLETPRLPKGYIHTQENGRRP